MKTKSLGGCVMGIIPSRNLEEQRREKDGIVYLPLKAIAADALGKKLCYDDTTIHYGMDCES